MKDIETSHILKKIQKIQLVKGEFTSSEASDIIMNLFNEKINFHKKQRLQLWEGNHKSNTEHLDKRIKGLENENNSNDGTLFLGGLSASDWTGTRGDGIGPAARCHDP